MVLKGFCQMNLLIPSFLCPLVIFHLLPLSLQIHYLMVQGIWAKVPLPRSITRTRTPFSLTARTQTRAQIAATRSS